MGISDTMGNESNKKTTMVLVLVIAMIVVLAAITYLFFYDNKPVYEDLPSNEVLAQQEQQAPQSAPQEDDFWVIVEADEVVNANNEAAIANASANTASATSAKPRTTTNAISKLKYSIKPLDKNIANCGTMRNGKWAMPDSCADSTIAEIEKLIATNAEIIALEVSGVVDNNPYAGPSAELKQEGLASFRAREAIRLITINFSNVAVFEGLSKEQANKRGFEIRAYYLQK